MAGKCSCVMSDCSAPSIPPSSSCTFSVLMFSSIAMLAAVSSISRCDLVKMVQMPVSATSEPLDRNTLGFCVFGFEALG